MAEATVMNGSCMAMAVVPAAPPYPNITNSNNITNTWTFGCRMPSVGNNDRCDVLYFSCEGQTYGLMPSEHASCDTIRAIYCVIGIEGYSGNGVAMPHACRVKYASIEGSAQGFGFLASGVTHIDADTIDCETVTSIIYDPSNINVGTMGLRLNTQGYIASGVMNGGQSVKPVVLDQIPGPVAVPQAAPASGVAWLNAYYRDAWITILATTTITALTITGANGGTAKAQNGLATAPASYTFLLPSASSYTPTISAAGTITHTVTLI